MECRLCFCLFVDIPAVTMPFQLPQLRLPCLLASRAVQASSAPRPTICRQGCRYWALCSPIFSVKVAVAYGFGNVL